MALTNRTEHSSDHISGWRGVPFKVLHAERERFTGDLRVYIQGQREPVILPESIAPYQEPVTHKQIAYINAVLEKRARGNIFHPRRHDAYKGFRQHTDQGAHP